MLATPRAVIFMLKEARIRSVIYTRVSSVKQVENESLDLQLRECKNFIASKNGEVVQIFEDAGESAKTTDRPGLLKMLEFIRENKEAVDSVVVWKVDRLSRSQIDYFALKKRLSDYGVILYSVTEPINEQDPISRAVEGIFSALAELDNATKAQRTVENMKAAYNAGRWQWKAKIGYLNAKGPKGSKTNIPIKDPDRFIVVQKGLKAFTTGVFSISDLTGMYKTWGLTSRMTNKPLTVSSISRMLRDPFYCGMMKSSEWGLSKGLHEAMITKEEYNKNISILDNKNSNLYVPHGANNELFPLRGDIKCHECGKTLTASRSKGESGKRYGYYHCHNKECSLRYKVRGLQSESVNNSFVTYLEQIIPNNDTLNLFKAILLDSWKEEVASSQEIINSIRKQLARCDIEKGKIFEVAKSGTFSAEYIRQQLEALENQEIVLKNQLSEISIDEYDIGTVINEGINFMKNPANTWRKSPLDTKQRIQKMIFPEGFYFDVENGFGTRRLSSPFAFCEALVSSETSLVTPRGIEPRLPG